MKDEDRTRFQKRFFDRFANSYYFLNILTFGLANLTRRRSLTALKIGEGEMICDLMCGDGSNIGILRRRFQHNRIWIGYI